MTAPNTTATTNPLASLLTPPPVPPHSSRPFILVPLYIYPAPGAWDPLYTAADAHPELDFYVVVNPSNGPGDGVLPDANYAVALGRLTASRNVKVVGYVHCSYGNRAAEAIVEDVERYRGWEGESVKAGIQVSFSYYSVFFFFLWLVVLEFLVWDAHTNGLSHFFHAREKAAKVGWLVG